jgi:hypothetical protein
MVYVVGGVQGETQAQVLKCSTSKMNRTEARRGGKNGLVIRREEAQESVTHQKTQKRREFQKVRLWSSMLHSAQRLVL